MRFETTCEPRNLRDAAAGMKVISLPVIVTDEHAASSYGIPVITDWDGNLIDYAEVASVQMPQRYSQCLQYGTGPNDYRPQVDWMRRMPVEITGVVPGWYEWEPEAASV